MTPGDDELLRRMRAGGTDGDLALGEFLESFRETLVERLEGRCRSRAMAEDVFSGLYLKLADKLPSFSGRGTLRGWVYRIAVNALRDQQRQDNLQTHYDDRPEDGPAPEARLRREADSRLTAPSVEDELAERQWQDCVEAQYERWANAHPDKVRDLERAVIEGMDLAALAKAADMGLAAMKQRVYRIKEELRERKANCTRNRPGLEP